MTILGRYVFRQTAGAVLLILSSLTGVIWIAVGLRQLELMTSQGQNGFVFLKMTALALPSLVVFIAPIALLIASLQTLNRLSSDSELIVMTAGGLASWRLLAPLMILAVAISAVVSYVNHIAAPWSNRLLRDFAVEVRTDLISQVLQPGRFTAAEPKLTIHIRDRAPDGRLLGLLMHDARNDKEITSYLAERGRLVKQNAAVYLLMEQGHILRQTGANQPADIIVFDKYAVDINRFEQKAETSFTLRPRERYSSELMNPDPEDPIYKALPGRYRSELHDRFASALYPIAFVLIALAFAGQVQTTRQNRSKMLVLGFAAAFGWRILGIGAANMAVIRPSAVWIMYAIPLAAIVLATLNVAYNMRPRPPSRLRRLIDAQSARIGAAMTRRTVAKAARGRRPRAAGA